MRPSQMEQQPGKRCLTKRNSSAGRAGQSEPDMPGSWECKAAMTVDAIVPRHTATGVGCITSQASLAVLRLPLPLPPPDPC